MRRHLNVSIQSCLLYFLVTLTFQAVAQQQNVPSKPQSDVILGVLEDHAGIYSGDPYFRVVRAVFQKHGNEWRSFPNDCTNTQCLKSLTKSYPRKVSWTIAFDGKDLGRMEARTPEDFRLYALVGMEEITTPEPVPTVGKRAREYGGFTDDPVYRPLAAVSQPNFKDPESWRPSRLSQEQLNAVRKEIRDKLPRASNCRDPHENKLKSKQPIVKEIKVVSTYSSKEGWSLVQLGLRGYYCDGIADDSGLFIGQWYLIEPSGKMRFLGSGMSLVDAGDYDGDGKSEVLFAVDGYDLCGYRLFYRDFSRSAEFLFSYH